MSDEPTRGSDGPTRDPDSQPANEQTERRPAEDSGDKSVLRIAVEALVRAPRRLKTALLVNVAVIAIVGVVEIMDITGSAGTSLALRLMALSMLMVGALLLSLASILWSFSQMGGQVCSPFAFKLEALMMRARRLDEVLMAIPLLVFFAGCFIVAAMVIYLTFATTAFARGLILTMGAFFLAWTAWMIAGTSRFLYTQAREQAEAAARARSEATEAQLAALQAQMNPHFLFNALNTVASLVKTDPEAAEVTVENLSVVLRRTLERSGRPIATVDDEVDYLAAYLSVAKSRFEQRLQVHWSIDPETRELLLPTMTLQPLVENSLRHGIGAQLEGGALHIGAHVDDGDATSKLVLEVADDGPGFPPRFEEGTGLQNLRARLETLFGDDASLRIDNGGPGSRVTIEMPAVEDADKVLADAFSRATTEEATTAGPLTDEDLRRMREDWHLGLHRMAQNLGTDLGRLSEDLQESIRGFVLDAELDAGGLAKEARRRATARMDWRRTRWERRAAKWGRRAARWAQRHGVTTPVADEEGEDE